MTTLADTSYLEGPWDEVTRLIGVAHTLVHHSGVPRIQTDVRITTRYVPERDTRKVAEASSNDFLLYRTDKKQPMEEIKRYAEKAHNG
jgi:uncharacterized protein YqgV (UPF0045/DUF77 family)